PLSILIRRRPPSAPPFPYTTLFRSQAAPHDEVGEDRGQGLVGEELVDLHAGDGPGQVARAEGVAQVGSNASAAEPLVDLVGHREDRKSTRLNSSHQIISYAVFCLKK